MDNSNSIIFILNKSVTTDTEIKLIVNYSFAQQNAGRLFPYELTMEVPTEHLF